MNLERHLKRLLRRYSDIILSIEEFLIISQEKLHIIRIKIVLIDFSTVYIRQIVKENKIEAYSYYWISRKGEIIEGWDNAPHHLNIVTYPHHRHVKNKVEPLYDFSLEKFLESIRSKLKTRG